MALYKLQSWQAQKLVISISERGTVSNNKWRFNSWQHLYNSNSHTAITHSTKLPHERANRTNVLMWHTIGSLLVSAGWNTQGQGRWFWFRWVTGHKGHRCHCVGRVAGELKGGKNVLWAAGRSEFVQNLKFVERLLQLNAWLVLPHLHAITLGLDPVLWGLLP